MERYTITKTGEGLVTEKKSRFLAMAMSVSSEAEAAEQIAKRKKEHYDARHNCYAYVLGENDAVRRASDDGEPSQTAGVPILEAIDAAGVRDVLVIVTRYFGGTLLGTGGLTRAYREAATAALSDAEKMLCLTGRRLDITIDYNGYGRLEYYMREHNIPVMSSDFGAEVRVGCMVGADEADAAVAAINELSAGGARCEIGEPVAYGLMGDKVVLL